MKRRKQQEQKNERVLKAMDMVIERQEQELKRKQAAIAANQVKKQRMMEKEEEKTGKDEEKMEIERTPPQQVSVQDLMFQAGLSSRQCEQVARMINPVAGWHLIQSRSAFKRMFRQKEMPVSVDDSVVGYADVFKRLSLLHSHFPQADSLRISSDKGGNCIKTSVAFAHSQSEFEVQIIHAVIADSESYDIMSTHVFPVYDQVKWYCSQHRLKMIITCDHKVTSLLLGHKGQSAKHPCWLCTLPQSQFHRFTFENISPYVRSLAEIHEHGTKMTKLNQRKEQQRARHERRSSKEKKHDDETDLQAASIANIPLNTTPTLQYVPAPLHTFMGLVNDIVIKDWMQIFGEQSVRTALKQHGVFFNRNEGHGLDGNAVKKLFEVGGDVLQSLRIRPHLYFFYGHLFDTLSYLYELSLSPRKLHPFELSPFADAIYDYTFWRSQISRMLYGVPYSPERRYTPKEHCLICHFLPFIQWHGSLGLYSEQAHEKIHHKFNIFFARIHGHSSQATARCIKYVNESHLRRLSLPVV